MSVFPGAIPPVGSASASDTLAAAGHTALHNANSNEINALATKVGTGSSTPASGLLLRGNGAGTSAWSQVGLTTDVSGVLPQANGGTGTTLATGTGKVVYDTSPTIATPTVSGGSFSSPTLTTPTIASFTNANHNHQNSAGGGTLGETALDWSTFSLNMKSVTNTGNTVSNANLDLANQGLTLGFTVAQACNALVTVSLGIGSSSDFEFQPQIRVDGAVIATLAPNAAPGLPTSRSTMRGFTGVIPLTAGVHTISAGVFLSSGTTLVFNIGGSTLSALILGTVTA